MSSLDLGVIGNCVVAALVDKRGSIVWHCYPRLDGDPVFSSLIDGRSESGLRSEWTIELEGFVRSEQRYVGNTAVLVTHLFAADGSCVEISDHCPRFEMNARMFRPQMLVRRIRPAGGVPRIRIRLKPAFEYGQPPLQITHGSNNIRFVGPRQTVRVTTDAPISYVLEERPFLLEGGVAFLLGGDETLRGGVEETARDFQEQTQTYWSQWVRRLALKVDWQEVVIRAAITLKLCTFEETGAIVAALTSSIPEAPDSGRNWDYRYCWLRDAYFVIRALNSLSDIETMEHYLRYLANIVTASTEGHLQPVYGVTLEKVLDEREIPGLSGYRGMGPVRVGNQAYQHLQHDVYGNIILAASQAFFDKRLLRPAGVVDFRRLERVGEQAWRVYATPDAGMWEFRTRAKIHTSSVLMSWAACDRLARIGSQCGLEDRVQVWQERAEAIRTAIETRAWNPKIGSYVESFGGTDVEGGLLLMSEVGFHPESHERIAGTIRSIERRLRRGAFLMRYATADDYGVPQTAFNACTFWYIDVLARSGRSAEARELFENMLACCNHVGLLSEDTAPSNRELWGNYPQTYSLAGIINAATRLSRRWDDVA